jgi:hypothetical protein
MHPLTSQSSRRLLMSLACLITLGVSLFLASGIASASTTAKPVLVVSPTIFNGNTDCTYSSGPGWSCTATLSRGDMLTKNLNWSASAAGITGIVFSPASGVLAPGATASVSIAVPDSVCPGRATFSFKGPGNTVKVPWSCGGPAMTLDQSNFTAGGNCPVASGGWTCTATVGETASSQGKLNWFASSGLAGVTFSPSSGTLSPGGSTAVSIFVPTSACKNGGFTFTSPNNHTIRALWSCKATTPPPATLVVSPTSLDPSNAACALSGSIIQCTVTLSETTNSTVNANWVANTTFSDSAVVPTQGTLTPGSSTQVVLDSLPCQNGSVTFTGSEGEAPVTVTFSCTPNTLTASPAQLNPTNAACSLSGSTYSCAMTLAETAGSPGNVNWTTASDMNSVTFSPASGTLSPGQSITVNVLGVPCQSGSFYFSGPPALTFDAIATWSCSPPPPSPTLTINIGNMAPSSANCSFSQNGNQCTVTLGETTGSTSNVDFSASSSFTGVTFSPQSGTLSPGGSTQVVITIAASACQNGTFTFSGSGGASSVGVNWFCSPAVLQVQPTQIDWTTCTSAFLSNVYTCTIQLSSPLDSQGPLAWTESSNMSGVNPGSGTLAPGQSVTFTVSNLPCQQGGTLTFSATDLLTGAPLNIVTVIWPSNAACG